MNPIQRLLSKKVASYDSGWKQPARLSLPPKKQPVEKLPQYEQQRRAMERNYNRGVHSDGKGVGP